MVKIKSEMNLFFQQERTEKTEFLKFISVISVSA